MRFQGTTLKLPFGRTALPAVLTVVLCLGPLTGIGRSVRDVQDVAAWIITTIESSSDSLLGKGAQDGPLRIQMVELKPFDAVEAGSSFPANVRSAGVAVYHPSSPADRYQDPSSTEPSGSLLYIANWLGDEVLVFDPETGTVIDSIAVGRNPGGLVISPDGSTLYAALEQGSGVAVIDRAAGVRTEVIQLDNVKPFGIGITPDGSMLLVCDANGGGRVHAIDTATGTVLRTLSTGALTEQVVVNAENSLAYVTSYGAGRLSVVDLSTLGIIARLDAPHAIGVALDPRGRWVYVTNAQDGTMLVFEVATNQLAAEWLAGGPGSEPSFIQPTPNGDRVLVTNRYQNFLTVIDMERKTSENITVGAGLGPMVLLPLKDANSAAGLSRGQPRLEYQELMAELRSNDERRRQEGLDRLNEIGDSRLTLRAMIDLSGSGHEKDTDLALATLSELLNSMANATPSGASYEGLQKAIASLIVNEAERRQQENLDAFHNSVRGPDDVSRARSKFFEIWQQELMIPCSDERLGSAGTKCIAERSPLGPYDWFNQFLKEIR